MAPRDPQPLSNSFRTLSSGSDASFDRNAIANFVKGLPKAELHLHIEGALEPELMFKLAQRNNVKLPYADIEAVKAAYNFDNLQDFLDLYYQGATVLLHELDFEELMYSYLVRAKADGVVRTEMFFDPQSHTERGVQFDTFMNGFKRAMERAEKELGISTALIMCFLRHLPPEDAMKTWQQAERFVKDGSIIGVGLDSSEKDFPPELFKDVFALAKQAGLKAVAHAGEEGPPEYIISALDQLGIDRLDHGVRAEEDNELMQRLIDSKMALTVCPFSNLELKVIDKLESHNLKRLLDAGVAVTINSDDPSYFGGYIAENYSATADALNLSQEDIVRIAQTSLEAAFATEEQKETWLKELADYVEGFRKVTTENPIQVEAKLTSLPS